MGMPDTVVTRPLSVSEYLRREYDSPVKHEFVAGEVFEMAGVARRHNRIAMNIATPLFAVTRRSGLCETFVAYMLLQAADDVFYYPDVMIACGPGNAADRVIRNPRVLVEVTSPSTWIIDHREKLAAYRKIESVASYLIVEQSRRSVERHWRDDRGEWWSETIVGEGRVAIPVVDVELTLIEIYDGSDVPGTNDGEPDVKR